MGETTDQSRFWDAAAATRQFGHPLDLERFVSRVARDARILDYGCGQGRLCGETLGDPLTPQARPPAFESKANGVIPAGGHGRAWGKAERVMEFALPKEDS